MQVNWKKMTRCRFKKCMEMKKIELLFIFIVHCFSSAQRIYTSWNIWNILNSALWLAVRHCSAGIFWRFSGSLTRALQRLRMTCAANMHCPLRRCWKTFALIAKWSFGQCKFNVRKSTSTGKAFVTGAKLWNAAHRLHLNRLPWKPWYKWHCVSSKTSKTWYPIWFSHSSNGFMPTFANCRIACCLQDRMLLFKQHEHATIQPHAQ